MVTGLDLFAGAGGLTIGLKAAGVRTACAVEADPYRTRTFGGHTPGAEIITGDIRGAAFDRYRGEVQLVYGGPPCQPFSSGGLRRSHADRRDMIPEFVRAVREVRPEAFLMENVPGLVTGDRLAYLSHIIGAFRELGFQVAWQVLNAADYGVPQKRRRLFVVGLRNAVFRFPDPTHGPGRPNPYVRVRDVLTGEQRGEPNASPVFYARNPDLRPSPYDGHLFNGAGRPINMDAPARTLLASAGGNRTHFFDTRRLVPSYHTHLLSGGLPHQGALSGDRRLTVRESADLQTFPATMEFCGSRSVQYRQIGDAVPPLLATVIGRSLLEQLNSPVVRPSALRHVVGGPYRFDAVDRVPSEHAITRSFGDRSRRS